MFIDEHGAGKRVEGGVKVDRDGIKRLQDVTMIHLQATGLTLAEIGEFFRMSPQGVHKRLSRIPANAREYHRARPLEGLRRA